MSLNFFSIAEARSVIVRGYYKPSTGRYIMSHYRTSHIYCPGTVPEKSKEKSNINKGFFRYFLNLAQNYIILNPEFETLNSKQNSKFQTLNSNIAYPGEATDSLSPQRRVADEMAPPLR